MIKGIRADNFICKCEKCESVNIIITPSTIFKNCEYYGTKITIKCLDCDNKFSEVY